MVFNDINYDNYLVQYHGDIVAELSKYTDYIVTLINNSFAIVSVKKDQEININDARNKTITYITPSTMYTLQEVTPLDASKAQLLQLNLPLSLKGDGVAIVLIDTGIDYLNEEFQTPDGQTRIELIWDQSILNDIQTDKRVPFGTIYTKDQINAAISASKEGNSPYDIVPSKDTIGHGTNMASIAGASGKNSQVQGVVPNCSFIIIKLIEDYSFETQFSTTVPVYNITSVFAAFNFIYEYSLTTTLPLSVLFPLGTNFGNHKKNGVLEDLITQLSLNLGVAVISATGNEADKGNHTTGVVASLQENAVVELNVSEGEKNLWVEFWTDTPNILSIDIISPSGENTGKFSSLLNVTTVYTYIFEKTTVKVNYFIPEEKTGDELIRIRFYNIESGIWKFRLSGDLILDGVFNAWLYQQGITLNRETAFRPAIPSGTVMNPSNASLVVTSAGYNQTNNNIVPYSGIAFPDYIIDVIDVACGCINAKAVGINNTVLTVEGTSVAAAILAGVVAMLFEWGIVLKNDPAIFSQTIKTYISRGTDKRKGDMYPNAQWGYGILDVLLVFRNLL